jgi:hypothetical protein
MTSLGEEEPQRHIAVFDCNVYLDVACLLGPPFSWEKFDQTAARVARDALPHPTDRAIDSLRAIAVCTSGRFAGDETVEVWTSAHIDKIVRGKATQPTDPDPRTGYRGLGWHKDLAESLLTDLIQGVTQRSNGGTVGDRYPDGHPPLDHEDGMVYGACRYLASDDPLARIYCITNDKEFVSASRQRRLVGHSTVLTAAAFVKLVRTARQQYSIRQMRST